jgi:hypothetical protein
MQLFWKFVDFWRLDFKKEIVGALGPKKQGRGL